MKSVVALPQVLVEVDGLQLEEAAILHVSDGRVTQEDLFVLRKELVASPDALRAFLSKRRLRLDLAM